MSNTQNLQHKMQNIAVLITCFNRKEKTIICLENLFKNKLPRGYKFEVFLVDDGSTDGTAEAIKKDFPEVNIIQGSGNLYWNRGMHLAWETATKTKDYSFYFWLNDDVELFYTALEDTLNIANKKPLSIISGVLKSKDNNLVTYGGRDHSGGLIEPNGEIQQSHLFNGNFVCVPKEVFLKVGSLDTLFIHSIGDFDYGLRAAKSGFKIYITPSFIGYCEKHLKPPLWCLPQVPIKKRITNLYSPLGNSHPYYYFRYTLRHFGILTAMRHFCSIHLRVLIPKLWK